MREEVESAPAGVQEGVHEGVHEAAQGGSKVPSLTAGRLRELLWYDPETGVFTWLVSRGSVAAGKVAGTRHGQGYITISIDGCLHLGHRLAVLYMTGDWPPADVDHKYGIRHDNRWTEIRQATVSQNLQNQRRAHARNKSGLLGVSQKGRRWAAKIQVNGENLCLGTFDTPELAHAAYLEAKAKHHEYQTLVRWQEPMHEATVSPPDKRYDAAPLEAVT